MKDDWTPYCPSFFKLLYLFYYRRLPFYLLSF
nr:MAG TPA: Fibrinogen alpha/beta chain family [Caudoviricetes sp.]